ncbi:MAG: alkaline phosphatase family protein [Gaiellales bacterium]
MRVLVLGLDGADPELVERLLAEGRLPTLARLRHDGAYGPLRSTLPAVTPTAWSSFLTGLNPAGHGIFNFSTNPNRSVMRVESAASRSGAPLWRMLGQAGIRSAFVTVPFTYPPEPIDGILVTGYGGPPRPEITPPEAAARIRAAYPELVTAHHPMAERWWEDFDRYARRLIEHVDDIAGVCRLAMDMEPDLGVLAVDFMSTDFAGHLGYHRLNPDHPAHDPAQSGDELAQVYEAVDRVCGELIQHARALYGEEPTALIMSDHGMKPIHWTFHVNRWLEEHGHLRFRRRSLQGLRGGRLDYLGKVDSRLVRTQGWYGRALDAVPALPRPGVDRVFADIDFGRTRAYCYGTGGQIFLGELTGAVRDSAYADALVAELEDVRHPETGAPAFSVLRKRDIYHGRHLRKAPELVVLPHDERIHVEAMRRRVRAAFERHEHLDPESFYGYSGHHGVTGILAAAGPGVRPGEVPEGSDITQMAATILRLHGLEPEGLDGAPIEAILEARERIGVAAASAPEASSAPVYSAEEEASIRERLRDLGYE